MKKIAWIISVVGVLLLPTFLHAQSAKGLNVMLTAKDTQTQMMAMVLSLMSIKEGKDINIVLCSNAGDLAVKGMKSQVLKPKNKSPKMLLKALIKKGANVQVCPLYLPNANKDASVLLKGISVAKPALVAKQLLNDEFQNLSY